MAPVGTAPTTAQQQTCAVGDVRPVLRSLVSQVRDLVGGMDPDEVLARQAVEAWDLCGELARLSTGAQTLVARRVAEAGVYKTAGARDTAEFLALRSGVSKSAMAQMLATSYRLAHQPVTAGAVRRGALSADQAHAVTDAAGTDLSEQRRLVEYARGRSLKELRDEALRAKAVADPAPEATRRRQQDERHFRQGTGADGRWWFKGEGPPEDRARFEAALNPFIETAFRSARQQGRKESRDVLAYDALQALARHAHQDHPATPGDPGSEANPNTAERPSHHDGPGHPHSAESSNSASSSQRADTESSRPQGATSPTNSPGRRDRGGRRGPGSQEDAAAGRRRSRETADLNDRRDGGPGGGREPGSQEDAAGRPESQGTSGGNDGPGHRHPEDGPSGGNELAPREDLVTGSAAAQGAAVGNANLRCGRPGSDTAPGPSGDAAAGGAPRESTNPKDDLGYDRGGGVSDSGTSRPQDGDAAGGPGSRGTSDGSGGPGCRHRDDGSGGDGAGSSEPYLGEDVAAGGGPVSRGAADGDCDLWDGYDYGGRGGDEPGPYGGAVAGDEPLHNTVDRNDDLRDDDDDRGGSASDGEPGPEGGDAGGPRRQKTSDGSDSPVPGDGFVPTDGFGGGGLLAGEAARSELNSTAKPPAKARRRENLSLLPVLRVDLAALQRSYLLAGEVCEVSSNGPLTVGAARELVGESVVKLALTRHGDVVTVAHLGRASSTPTQLAILHADVTALTPTAAGVVVGDGACRLPGVGVVERSAAQRLLGQLDGTDVLDRVLARGRDVAALVHFGRQPTVAQRTALLWAQPACSVRGCAHTFTQIDHRREWRKQNLTELANLDRLCAHHHRLKSHQNYQLVPGTGDRAFVSPEDPRHPDNQSLATPRDRAPPQAA